MKPTCIICHGPLERDRSMDAYCCSCTDKGIRYVKISYNSDVIGSGSFYEGPVGPDTTIYDVRNFVALGLAKKAAHTRLPQTTGMWRAELAEPDEGANE